MSNAGLKCIYSQRSVPRFALRGGQMPEVIVLSLRQGNSLLKTVPRFILPPKILEHPPERVVELRAFRYASKLGTFRRDRCCLQLIARDQGQTQIKMGLGFVGFDLCGASQMYRSLCRLACVKKQPAERELSRIKLRLFSYR